MCDRCTHRKEPEKKTRRRLLAASAAVLGTSLAGCLGNDGGGDGGSTPAAQQTTTTEPATATEQSTTSERATGDDQPSTTDPGTTDEQPPGPDEAVEPVPADAKCAVCQMAPAKYPDWNAQATHEDGDRAFFCSPGCLVSYVAIPGHFAEGHSRSDLAGVWARDVDSSALVDATAAHWVLERDAERIDAPMMRNPLPFDTEDGALAYVDRYDDRTAHDVVGLDVFDVALARTYRARMLPEASTASVLAPVAVSDDESCGVCQMKPAMTPDWNAQLSTESGDRVHFCSPGCLAAYHADPGHFTQGRTQGDVVGVWVHDVETGDLVDGTLASYVLETDADRVDDPMMTNPLPFAAETDATAYVDAYEDLGPSDVVTLSGITRQVAASYRGKFL
jgi:copper chaperone NosL